MWAGGCRPTTEGDVALLSSRGPQNPRLVGKGRSLPVRPPWFSESRSSPEARVSVHTGGVRPVRIPFTVHPCTPRPPTSVLVCWLVLDFYEEFDPDLLSDKGESTVTLPHLVLSLGIFGPYSPPQVTPTYEETGDQGLGPRHWWDGHKV